MSDGHENDPLHGITLEAMLLALHEKYGWEGLAEYIPIRCFTSDPSVKSSLAFLRRTPWARAKVEALYLGKLRKRRPGPGRPYGRRPDTRKPDPRGPNERGPEARRPGRPKREGA